MSNADLLLFLQNRDTFCNSSVCALQCLSKTTMCVIRDDGRFSVIFQILIRKTKTKFCTLPLSKKHHKSAKLPWYHNIKLSFWSLSFFLFVFFPLIICIQHWQQVCLYLVVSWKLVEYIENCVHCTWTGYGSALAGRSLQNTPVQGTCLSGASSGHHLVTTPSLPCNKALNLRETEG